VALKMKQFFLVFSLLFLCSFISFAFAKDCMTISTTGGTKVSEKCVFPFRYAKKSYNSCTTEYEDSGTPWCSVQVDANGVHVQTRWGFCDSSNCISKSEEDDDAAIQCTTVSISEFFWS
jgi:hypothetical protein